MYLFRVFRSFLPMHNPIGFGASDFIVLTLAVLVCGLLTARTFVIPFARQIASRTFACMGMIFGLTIALRLLLLPQSPAPAPTGADDFSYILLGDTLRHLRLANAPHPLHQFFEAVFVLQQPAYASIYPIGQGLALAFGWMTIQSFWAGVLVSCGVFCVLCYWMLRGWVAPHWALLGGMLAVIQFGPLCPWVNSYWGGAISASAGCLVFGSLPRLRATPRIRYGALLGTGLGLQILTRPFEAVFLAFSIAVYLMVAFGRNWRTAAKPALAGLAVVMGALGLTVLQNKAVTYTWTTMPYMLSRYEYGVPTTWTFQPNPIPHRQLTPEQELDYKAQAAIHGTGVDSAGLYLHRLLYRFRYLRFFLLAPLFFPMAAFLPSLRQWRFVWAAGTVLVFALGTNFYSYFYPHYVAAIACLLVLFSVMGLERLRSSGATYIVVLCFASFMFWFGLCLSGNEDLLAINSYQSWYYINRGDPQGREAVQDRLDRSPGKQLVFVRYAPSHRFEEWIHNAAEIDAARTVWANDLGTEENEKLLRYYPQRKAWLLEPDAHPPALVPYPSGEGAFVTVH